MAPALAPVRASITSQVGRESNGPGQELNGPWGRRTVLQSTQVTLAHSPFATAEELPRADEDQPHAVQLQFGSSWQRLDGPGPVVEAVEVVEVVEAVDGAQLGGAAGSRRWLATERPGVESQASGEDGGISGTAGAAGSRSCSPQPNISSLARLTPPAAALGLCQGGSGSGSLGKAASHQQGSGLARTGSSAQGAGTRGQQPLGWMGPGAPAGPSQGAEGQGGGSGSAVGRGSGSRPSSAARSHSLASSTFFSEVRGIAGARKEG